MAVSKIERITNNNSLVLNVEELVDGLRDMMNDLDAFTLATKIINGTEATIFIDEGQEITYKPIPEEYTSDIPVRYCDPNNKFIGSKSLEGRVFYKEAAKGIRADIKEAKKLGYIPKSAKVSVRCCRGRSIDVEITSCDFMVVNPKAVAYRMENPNCYRLPVGLEELTQKAQAVKEKLEEIVTNYYYDNSDSMVDYFDTNFYCYPGYDYSLKAEQKEQIEQAYKRGVKLSEKY